MTAINAIVQSAYSNVASASVPILPAVPTALTAVNGAECRRAAHRQSHLDGEHVKRDRVHDPAVGQLDLRQRHHHDQRGAHGDHPDGLRPQPEHGVLLPHPGQQRGDRLVRMAERGAVPESSPTRNRTTRLGRRFPAPPQLLEAATAVRQPEKDHDHAHDTSVPTEHLEGRCPWQREPRGPVELASRCAPGRRVLPATSSASSSSRPESGLDGIPLAVADTIRQPWWQPGVTHYTIDIGQFTDQLHPDLPNSTRPVGFRSERELPSPRRHHRGQARCAGPGHVPYSGADAHPAGRSLIMGTKNQHNPANSISTAASSRG